MPPDAPLGLAEPVVKGEPADTEQVSSRLQPFNAPIQIWACTGPDHRHLAKADALKCLEGGTGLAEDRRATAAAGPASAKDRSSLTKALRDVGQIARTIAELEWLREALELEAAIENDQSPQPARLQAIITELCDFLSSLADEETAEVPGDAEPNGPLTGSTMPEMLGMAEERPILRASLLFSGKRRAPIRRSSLAAPSRRPSTRGATRRCCGYGPFRVRPMSGNSTGYRSMSRRIWSRRAIICRQLVRRARPAPDHRKNGGRRSFASFAGIPCG